VLAELVGPGGTAVGLDANPAALAQARAMLARLGVGGVELVEADVNALDHVTGLRPGSVDVVYCRIVLINQSQPVAALRQITRLV
jgi:ubiquinone/menaquinone biosynthesis C-methylase UbiE